jgi:apolipoprotein N-acyltransferase
VGVTSWQMWQAAKRRLRLLGIAGKREDPARPAGDRSSLATWSESFICAGGSAFLLRVATLFPNYWYVSFFALAPLLLRVVKAGARECLRLGFIFGLSFFALSMIGSPAASPLPSLLKLLSGTALFAVFGWAAGWARQRWGFNPFILVFLWTGLELGLVRLGFVGGLLGEAQSSHPVFGGLIALFGFLAVSALIVLLNSLLVLAIVKTLQLRKPRGRILLELERILDLVSGAGVFAQRVYLVPESRAPPYIVLCRSEYGSSCRS